MHPTFLDSMSWEMAEVYGAITDQILINLARHFPFYVAGEDVPRSAFAYQAKMLAQMGQVSKETMQIIRNGLSDADMALQGVLEQAVIDAVKSSEPELLEAVKKGVFSPAGAPAVSPNQTRAFELYYQQASDKLNLVNTVMLESTRSAYQQTIADVVSDIELSDAMNAVHTALDVAAGETITGVSSWNAALKHATDRLKERGITGFVDHGGHEWSAEAYVAMDIRTTVFNTARSATWELNQDFGNDLYLVSYHNGARPLCYDWQNKVISSTDNERDVRDLDGNLVHVYAQSRTTYGQPAGLFGINCKHYPTPFIPGVSTIDGQPQDKEENDRVYKESQEQRRLERKLREQKRDLLMAKEQGASTEELNKMREKCRQTSSDIDEFCRETGRTRHRDREAVYTKREFPDKEKYDVSAFEKQQQEAINKYFSGGGSQTGYTFGQLTQNEPGIPTPTPTQTPTAPVAPVQQTTPQAFTPAKTIEEAEQFARDTFVDTKQWGSQGLSLSGISVDSANTVNQRLADFYNEYNVDKLSSLVAPAGNTKLGKAIQGAHAGFNPINKAMVLNRNSLKNPLQVIESIAKEGELVKDYLANPDKYSRLDKYTRKMLENSRQSGRFSVARNLGEILDHECGHFLGKYIRNFENYERIVENMGQYAGGISGYAQESANEYIAESFCAWKNGIATIDPELAQAFIKMRR